MSQTMLQLNALLLESAKELFDVYGCPLAEIEAQDPTLPVESASRIGFVSNGFKGTLTIAMDVPLLVHITPIGDPQDWLRELANQLLGRFKNKLHCWGIDLAMETPVLVCPDHCQTWLGAHEGRTHHTLHSETGNAHLVMEIAIDDARELEVLYREPEHHVFSEGEALLFF